MLVMPNNDEPPKIRFYPNQWFLPDGSPLHGNFARVNGVLFLCRPERNGSSLGPRERLVLLTTGENPGSGWELKPVFGSSPISQWSKVIEQSEAEELFSCSAKATWHSIDFSDPTYLPEGDLIGGFIDRADRDFESRAHGIQRLERVDQGSWYGYVPLEELDHLEITRQPWPHLNAADPLPAPVDGRGKNWHSWIGRVFGRGTGAAD